jgi:hypothetical protein
MSYFWTCPYCEANLDPGEKCECQEHEYINKIHHKKLSKYMEDITNELISN